MKLKITDVQWILGHAHLSTTELYLNTTPQDAIDDVLAHYQRRSEARKAMATPPEPSPVRYRPAALASRDTVVSEAMACPYAGAENGQSRHFRRLGVLRMLDWL